MLQVMLTFIMVSLLAGSETSEHPPDATCSLSAESIVVNMKERRLKLPSEAQLVLQTSSNQGRLKLTLLDLEQHVVWTRELPSEPCWEARDATALSLGAAVHAQVGYVFEFPKVLLPAKPQPRSQATRSVFEFGGSGALTPTSRGLGGGVRLDVNYGREGASWRFGGSLWGMAEQAYSLAPGFIRSQRLGLSAGGKYCLSLSPNWGLEFEGQLTAALLALQARGFTEEASNWGFDPGASVAVRATYKLGNWVPFMGLGTNVWFRRTVIEVPGVNEFAALDRMTALASVGFFWESVR